MGTRCGIYARQSHGKQISMDNQVERGKRRAADEGWEVSVVLRDGVSASRQGKGKTVRQNWMQLLALVAAGELDLIWLWEASRGDRDSLSWGGFLQLCEERKVKIYANNLRRVFDLDVARDRKDMREAGSDANYETDVLSERVMDSKNDARSRGDLKTVVGGRAPYGWRDPGRGHQWVIEDSASQMLTSIAMRLLAGEELVQVHAELADSLVDAYGLRMNYARLRRTLLSPTGAGLVTDQHGAIIGGVPGPLDVSLWERLQVLFSTRKRGRTATGNFPLGKVLSCGKCGNQLTGSKNPTGPARVYRCSTPHKSTGHLTPCHGISIDADVVHAVVAEEYEDWRTHSPHARRMAEGAFDASPRRAALATEWTSLQEQLGNAVVMRAEGQLTVARFDELNAIIQAGFARIKSEQEMLAAAQANPTPLGKAWDEMTAAQKSRMVEEIFVTPIRVRPQAETGTRVQRDRLAGCLILRD